jgi:hypothetical protein
MTNGKAKGKGNEKSGFPAGMTNGKAKNNGRSKGKNNSRSFALLRMTTG